jgi:hypothetical protein
MDFDDRSPTPVLVDTESAQLVPAWMHRELSSADTSKAELLRAPSVGEFDPASTMHDFSTARAIVVQPLAALRRSGTFCFTGPEDDLQRTNSSTSELFAAPDPAPPLSSQEMNF